MQHTVSPCNPIHIVDEDVWPSISEVLPLNAIPELHATRATSALVLWTRHILARTWQTYSCSLEILYLLESKSLHALDKVLSQFAHGWMVHDQNRRESLWLGGMRKTERSLSHVLEFKVRKTQGGARQTLGGQRS